MIVARVQFSTKFRFPVGPHFSSPPRPLVRSVTFSVPTAPGGPMSWRLPMR